MPQGWREQLDSTIAATKRAIRAREEDLRRVADHAEAKGREIYERSIRTGEKVLARTEAELRALGAAALRQPPARKAASPPRSSASGPARPVAQTAAARPVKSVEGQLRAGLSGAVDEFTFGLADRGLAAADAIMDGGLTDFGQRYAGNMEAKRAEDARDARDYAIERNAGRTVGLAAGLVATGPAGAAIKAGLRTVPRVAKIMTHAAKVPTNRVLREAGVDPRGLTTAAVVGGSLVGVAGQGMADLTTRGPSSARDYVGAAIGGGLGGFAALRGSPSIRGRPVVSKAVFSGAVGGAATSVAQDALQGRMPSYARATEAAHLGGMSAGVLDGLATHVAAALPKKLKGELGERLSEFKSIARGRVPTTKLLIPVGRDLAAVPDQIHHREFFRDLPEVEYLEAKFGPSTRLSRGQALLRAQNPDRFAIDAWQFRHAGRVAGLAGGPFGAQLVDGQ